MGTSEAPERKALKHHLKVLLYDLAARTDDPAYELERLITEVINELYWDAKQALEERRSKLTLISQNQNDTIE